MTETKPDVEAQTAPPAAAASAPPAAPVSSGEYDEDAGKGLGIASFVLLLVAFVLGWFLNIILSWIAFICVVVAIIITSTISCGCCCASNLKLNPKVKRWNDAVLVTICIQIVLAIIGAIIGYSAGGATTGYVVIYWINRILNILSIVFAGIFAFGRKCCGNA